MYVRSGTLIFTPWEVFRDYKENIAHRRKELTIKTNISLFQHFHNGKILWTNNWGISSSIEKIYDKNGQKKLVDLYFKNKNYILLNTWEQVEKYKLLI